MPDGNDADWHRWRAAGLGASDIAGAYTRSYGNDPYLLVATKLGLHTEDHDQATLDRFQKGHDYEPVIAATVELLTGLTVAGEQTWCVHPEHEWMRATVDGFALEEGDDIASAVAVVEIKTTSAHRLNWDYYTSQVQWQMMVTDLPAAVVAVMHDHDQGRTVHLRQIEADPAVQAELFEFGQRVWDAVQAQELPEPTSLDAVRKMHPAPTDTEPVEVDADLVDELRRAQEWLKALEEQVDGLKAQLADAIGDHEVATVGGEVVATWKAQNQNRWDFAALAAEPQLVEKYRSTGTTRVLRVKKGPGE